MHLLTWQVFTSIHNFYFIISSEDLPSKKGSQLYLVCC